MVLHTVTDAISVPAGETDGAAGREDSWSRSYRDLRSIAGSYLRRESGARTLQATALVHEAWLRLAAREEVGRMSRASFFSAAAQAMRRILIDRGRRRGALRRGGDRRALELDEEAVVEVGRTDVLALGEALARLRAKDERLARVVKLCYFEGCTFEEAAAQMGVATITAKRLMKLAKGWIHRELSQ